MGAKRKHKIQTGATYGTYRVTGYAGLHPVNRERQYTAICMKCGTEHVKLVNALIRKPGFCMHCETKNAAPKIYQPTTLQKIALGLTQ